MAHLASAAAKNRSTSGWLSRENGNAEGDEGLLLSSDSIVNIFRRLPKPDCHLRTGVVDQCCANNQWTARRLILTHDTLFVTSIQEDRIFVEIDFKHVLTIEEIEPGAALYENRRRCSSSNILAKTSSASQSTSFRNRRPALTFRIKLEATPFRDQQSLFFKSHPQDAQSWLDDLNQHLSEYRQKNLQPTLLHHIRTWMTYVYSSNACQGFIAFLIFSNFVINAVQSQYIPDPGSSEEAVYDGLDTGFTVLFTLELCFNLSVNWFSPFFTDGWNVFDLIVVATSLLALGLQDLPGVSILRIVRAFRVLRLFGRLGSLRRIINALTCSWLPVLNAFAVVMFITAVYAILGVTFFRERSEQHFGNFSTAFYTMFTVTTMEGWVDLMRDHMSPEDSVDPGAAFFFVSFILIVVWTMLPVVVAILLDNFTMAATKEESKAEEDRIVGGLREMLHSLDPLMRMLAMFTSEHDLRSRIAELYKLFNVDECAALGYDELREGFGKLMVSAVPINLTEEEYDRLTKKGELCNADGLLGPQEFERVIVRELRDFTERGIASAMALEMVNGSAGMVAALCSLKIQGLDFDSDFEDINAAATINVQRHMSISGPACDSDSHGGSRTDLESPTNGKKWMLGMLSGIGGGKRRSSISTFINGDRQDSFATTHFSTRTRLPSEGVEGGSVRGKRWKRSGSAQATLEQELEQLARESRGGGGGETKVDVEHKPVQRLRELVVEPDAKFTPTLPDIPGSAHGSSVGSPSTDGFGRTKSSATGFLGAGRRKKDGKQAGKGGYLGAVEPLEEEGKTERSGEEVESGMRAVQEALRALQAEQTRQMLTQDRILMALTQLQQEGRSQAGSSAYEDEGSKYIARPLCGVCRGMGRGTEHCWDCGVVLCRQCRLLHSQDPSTANHAVHSLRDQVDTTGGLRALHTGVRPQTKTLRFRKRRGTSREGAARTVVQFGNPPRTGAGKAAAGEAGGGGGWKVLEERAQSAGGLWGEGETFEGMEIVTATSDSPLPDAPLDKAQSRASEGSGVDAQAVGSFGRGGAASVGGRRVEHRIALEPEEGMQGCDLGVLETQRGLLVEPPGSTKDPRNLSVGSDDA